MHERARLDVSALREQRLEIQLTPVAEDVRVGVGGQRELALADKPRDLGPRAALPRICPNDPRYSARQALRAISGESRLAQPTDQVSEPMCLESLGALVAMV